MDKVSATPAAQDGGVAIRALAGTTPLVFDSPHSGTRYPGDFRFSCDFARLRTAEDTHVEKLYDFAPQLGIAWIEALFPRSYLDANRSDEEIDVDMLDGPWRGSVASDPRVLSKVRACIAALWNGVAWMGSSDAAAGVESAHGQRFPIARSQRGRTRDPRDRRHHAAGVRLAAQRHALSRGLPHHLPAR